MQMEKEDRHASRAMRTSTGTVTWGSIKSVDEEERKQKEGIGREHYT